MDHYPGEILLGWAMLDWLTEEITNWLFTCPDRHGPIATINSHELLAINHSFQRLSATLLVHPVCAASPPHTAIIKVTWVVVQAWFVAVDGHIGNGRIPSTLLSLSGNRAPLRHVTIRWDENKKLSFPSPCVSIDNGLWNPSSIINWNSLLPIINGKSEAEVKASQPTAWSSTLMRIFGVVNGRKPMRNLYRLHAYRDPKWGIHFFTTSVNHIINHGRAGSHGCARTFDHVCWVGEDNDDAAERWVDVLMDQIKKILFGWKDFSWLRRYSSVEKILLDFGTSMW